MSRDGEAAQPSKAEGGGMRAARPPRRPRLSSRLRASVWRGIHGVLATDGLWSGALIAVILLALGTQRCGPTYEHYEPGQRAVTDIRAFEEFEFVDARQTDAARREAAEVVLEIYDHDTGRGLLRARQVAELFEAGRAALRDAAERGEPPLEAVARAIGDRTPEGALPVLVRRGLDAALEREITDALREVLGGRVVSGKPILERQAAVTLRRLPGGREERVERFDDFVDLEQARGELRRRVAERLALPASEERVLGHLAASYADASVTVNPLATAERREDAARRVRSVIQRVKQGELLAAAGQPLTQDIIDMLDAARLRSNARLGVTGWLGLLFVAAAFAFFLYRYTRYQQRHFRKLEHLHALIVLMIVSVLALSSAILWVAREVVDTFAAPLNRLDSYAYLIPVGAGAILVALLANGRIATVYSAFVALLFGAVNGWDAYLMVWAMIVQCAGVYAISTYRERAALLRAGLVVGSIGAVGAVAVESLRDPGTALVPLVHAAGLAFISGAIGAGLLISFSLPMLERLFTVLTDIRLLELSNVNNPLLSELALKAPGSYSHSLVVGTLAEEAARAISANALFCRVAAFYHDIGKMHKAEYFVENQRGINPHDRLSPSMSALIIASHVKDGIRMARDAGLPEQIVDIIPQHHGTKLMTYFYEKAKSGADPAQRPVDQNDFRYPGPKPQTREAAIFMLADGVEAAARTIDEPTANRLREMIRKVTNAIVLDGQLDACDLTFADLDRIQQAFLRCLVSMYHHRVDYPGFDFGRPRSEPRERRGEGRTNGKGADPLDRKVARGS
jgi:hypothetical protein